MSDEKKKNIDRLFQEKFKDFDPAPESAVWENIKAKLDAQEKESDRVIPIWWWRLGGIAAALAFLLTIGSLTNWFQKENEQFQAPKETITDTNEPKATETQKTDDQDADNKVIEQKDQFNTPQKNNIQEEVANAQKNNANINSSATNNLSTSDAKENNSVAIAKTNIASPLKKNILNKDIEKSSNYTDEKALAKNDDENKERDNKLNAIDKGKVAEVAADEKDIEQAVAQDEKKKSIFDAIKEQEDLKKDVVAVENTERWSLNPNVAPVYFSSLRNGSPINPRFNDNVKSTNINLSYGISVAYQINKRLSIRTGVNQVNLGYDTNDVSVTMLDGAVASNVVAQQNNITFNQSSNNIILGDTPRIGGRALTQQQSSDVFLASSVPQVNAVLTQEFGYIEVPLEIKYRLIDRRLGVNIIGGVSSLFLTDNSISVSSETISSEIGEANNINSTNFSTNFGIGIDYRISKKILFNVEPVFKYQLNTFADETNGGFLPYTLGIHTGINIKF